VTAFARVPTEQTSSPAIVALSCAISGEEVVGEKSVRAVVFSIVAEDLQ